MFRYLFVALLFLPLTSFAQKFDPNRKIDGHTGALGYNSGLTADLPQGANRLQLWVVLSPEYRSKPHEYKVAQWFTGARTPQGQYTSPDARLRKLQTECAWNYYESKNPLFAESGLVQAVGNATPIVCLTAADGDVSHGVYLNYTTLSKLKNSGELADILMAGANQLSPTPQFDNHPNPVSQTNSILYESSAKCPRCGTSGVSAVGDCPNCTPKPTPTPGPSPTNVPVDGTLSEVKPNTAGDLGSVAVAISAALGLAAAGLGAAVYKKSQNQSFLRPSK